MNRFLSIILLFVFLYHSTSELRILIHFYANQDFIEKNMCINRFKASPVCKGSCFLKAQLSKNKQKSSHKDFPKIEKQKIVLFIHTSSPNKKTILSLKRENHLSHFIPLLYTSEHLFSIFHPPKTAHLYS
ncbi:hypothetical protein [Aquimarina hainanensis]|uniref:hypothetical protein n=1 Tax=Aquimarina hainanensis TaxID=1578017 RepID=UPI00360EA733